LEQIELVVPRMYKEEVVVRSVVPLLKELVYNTMVPRWWFFEQAKLYNQTLPMQQFEEELMYNTMMMPRCFEEEKMIKKELVLPTMPLEKELIYNTMMMPRCVEEEEKMMLKEKLCTMVPRCLEEEKFVEKEMLYKQMMMTMPRRHFCEEVEEELCFPLTKMQLLGEEKMMMKKEEEIVMPTLYKQMPRHFFEQEEKLVEKCMPLEKELIYNTMIPHCFEEKIVKKEFLPTGELIVIKEIVLPTGEKKIVKEIVLPTGEKKIVKEIIVPTTTLPFAMPLEKEMLYKQMMMPRRHFCEEEKLVEKKQFVQQPRWF